MKVLEDEINELHKSNTQLESEMSQLKAQISNMENKMSVQERENQVRDLYYFVTLKSHVVLLFLSKVHVKILLLIENLL